MSRPKSTRRVPAAGERPEPPVSWDPQTLAVLRMVRRWLANEANELRQVLDEYCELEEGGQSHTRRDRAALEELYEFARAQQQTLDALTAPQAAEPVTGDAVQMLALDRALAVVWSAKSRARRGMYRRELAAAATASPPVVAGGPSERAPRPGRRAKNRGPRVTPRGAR
ncbi:hypothetical protein [Sorangium sp. So ce1151]|uniref:hypothetical protein n=1 Tax=Sorangium sp. So ce1151 TaxID=3133332 RepID=UPI003F5DF9A0